MSRFFTDNITGHTAVITGEDVRHITKVLRLKSGDAVTVCDGRGTEYPARIGSFADGEVICDLSDPIASAAEYRTRISLFQGFPKSGKMEYIVQKCVEVGVHEIIPVLFHRCVAVPAGDFEKKRTRYQRVSLEAAKQSGRGIIPQIGNLVRLKGIDFSAYDSVLVAYEGERDASLKSALRCMRGDRIAILIGPEGGIEEDEVRYLKGLGAKTVSLGRSILRTETAGLVMAARILYELE